MMSLKIIFSVENVSLAVKERLVKQMCLILFSERGQNQSHLFLAPFPVNASSIALAIFLLDTHSSIVSAVC